MPVVNLIVTLRSPFRIIGVCLLLAWGAMAAWAQAPNDERNRLLADLDKAKSGKDSLPILNQLAELIMEEQPAIALQYTQRALRLAWIHQDRTQYATAKYNIAHYFTNSGVLDSAMRNHEQALASRLERPDFIEVAQSYNGIGVVWGEWGTPDSAINNYIRALEYVERAEAGKMADAEAIELKATILSNLGVSYYNQKQYAAALAQLKQSLAIDRARQNEPNISKCLSNLGAISLAMGNCDSALSYHQEGLALRKRLGNRLDIAKTYNNIGNVYSACGQPREAVENYQMALEIKRSTGNTFEVARTLNNLGILHNNMGRHEDALRSLQEARTILDTLDALPLRYTTYAELSKAYAGTGQYQLAYETQLKAGGIQDSVMGVERQRSFDAMAAKYNFADQEKKIAKLNEITAVRDLEAATLRQRFYIVGGGFIIAVLLALTILFAVLYLNGRNRRLRALNHQLEERNREIARKNEEIRQQSTLLAARHDEIATINTDLERIVAERTANLLRSNEELDTFLHQSSHALRGPLMRIAGLMEIMRKETDVQAALLMHEKVEQTIQGMDRMLYKLMVATEIHRRVLRPENIALRPLVADLLASVQAHAQPAEVEVLTDIPEGMISVPDHFIFEIVLQNLLENALQFRVAGRPHRVEVQITLAGNNLRIRIRDNGEGVPPDQQDKLFQMFVRATANSVGMGLGLYVVRKAVERIGGKVGLRSEHGIYTEIYAELPLEFREVALKVEGREVD